MDADFTSVYSQSSKESNGGSGSTFASDWDSRGSDPTVAEGRSARRMHDFLGQAARAGRKVRCRLNFNAPSTNCYEDNPAREAAKQAHPVLLHDDAQRSGSEAACQNDADFLWGFDEEG